MKPAIEVLQVTKKYILQKDAPIYGSLRDIIAKQTRYFFSKKTKQPYAEELLALDNVSFTINVGDVLGIIGPNGAGKSTLLKALSRVIYISEGKIVLHGRTTSLLEVGVGFHMELSGRENIYLNGVLLGMSKKEIDRKFDQIVEFSGLEKFIDMPVKQYSSGMFVRLGFSVAAHLDADILILDEVLSVGDLEFQEKSLQKIKQLMKERDRTIVVVSHDMKLIEKLCNKSVLLIGGAVVAFGLTKNVIEEYYARVSSRTNA